MPWTVKDVDKHKTGLTGRQKRQWVAVANSALERCLENGRNQEECETSAIRQANSVVGNNSESGKVYSGHSFLQVNNYEVRSETHQNRPHIVVPVVMMVEGVHCGSHGAIFHSIDELGRFPGAWDGIPVAILHPEEDGNPISANSPDIVDSQVVGRVYHTKVDENRLRAECWIDVERIAEFSPVTLQYIQKKKPLEISVGVFTDDEECSGTWNGEEYYAIARNHRPDHLALLPGGAGACSWEDGCGIRLNQGGESMKTEEGIETRIRASARTPSFSGTESVSWVGIVTTFTAYRDAYYRKTGIDEPEDSPSRVRDAPAVMRRWIASKTLLGDGNAEEERDLLFFPVVNPGTDKLNEGALRAVIGGRGTQADIPQAAKQSAQRRARSLLNREFGAELETDSTDELLEIRKKLALKGFSVVEINRDQGYREILEIIQHKLDRMDTDTKMHFLKEVYDDFFVYEVRTTSGNRPFADSGLYKRIYEVSDEDGSIEFEGEPEQVTQQTQYVPVQANSAMKRTKLKGGQKMSNKEGCCKEKVKLLIQNDQTKWEESDQEWLLSLEEAQIDKMLPNEAKLKTNVSTSSDPEGKKTDPQDDMTREQAAQVMRKELSDPVRFMSLLPHEAREQMEHGMRLHQEHRQGLIDHIVTNTDAFEEEELKIRGTAELEKLAKAVHTRTDFSAFATGSSKVTKMDNYRREALYPPGVVVESQ